ncbi:uncharacterized protein LODBEIA_P32230 [Lodderomyces beijingensis]|uniref:SPT2 chromatin protein n=1 Tax=Lodderomyces beijingensis TaxID=1775926 RepID=A0ABP0ZLH1_9ASCO
MGLSSILSRIDKKGQPLPKSISDPEPSSPRQNAARISVNDDAKRGSFSTTPAAKPVQPKAGDQRRQETLKSKQPVPRANVPARPASNPRGSLVHGPNATISSTNVSHKPSHNTATLPRKQPATTKTSSSLLAKGSSSFEPVVTPAKPKMSYSELMKKAAGIDHSKLSIKYPQKERTSKGEKPATSPKRSSPKPDLTAPNPAKSVSSRTASSPRERDGHGNRAQPMARTGEATSSNRPTKFPESTKKMASPNPKKPSVARESEQARPKQKVPEPTRQASAKLQAMLDKKRQRDNKQLHLRGRGGRHEEDSEDDLSDFVASDEEELDDGVDYNRDEIWAMFNKGKRHHYDYDDDSDDMEATGAEVFEEERRSKINADREDRLEQERLDRLAEQKRKRLRHS